MLKKVAMTALNAISGGNVIAVRAYVFLASEGIVESRALKRECYYGDESREGG